MKLSFYLKYGISVVALFISVNANAVFKQNYPIKVNQPDGTEISCLVTGDEFYRRFHDKNGYTIVQNDKGYYVYAIESKGRIVPSNYVVGSTNPSKIRGIRPNIMISKEEYHRLRKARNHPKPEGLKSLHMSNIRQNGKETITMNNIVIFIKFADSEDPNENISFYDGIYNTKTDYSVSDYYKSVSYNQFDIHSTFYPSASDSIIVWYTDSHNRNYYQPYNATTNPDGYNPDASNTSSNSIAYREHTLLRNAINSVTIPSDLDIDINNDGYVDAVSFVIQGTNDGWSDMLWPHQWKLFSFNVSINSKRVYDYTFQLQKYQNKPLDLGTLCHEMFHLLGAPDLYHYDASPDIDAVGSWDVMCSTKNYPQSMGAYMKYKYGGWIDSIPLINSSKTLTINPLTSSSSDNIYKIPSSSASEFYVVEYRKKEGFDASLPNEGLLVYRINSLYEGNASGPPDEVYIYRPNGTLTVEGQLNNAPFSSQMNRTAINSNTNPSGFLSDGTDGGLDISDISSAGESMTFTVNVNISTNTLLQNDNGVSGYSYGSASSPIQLTAATRFTIDDLQQHVGKNITNVLIYFLTSNGADVVTNETIKIWKGGNNNGAGMEVYRKNIANTIEYDSWYSHSVTIPITIEADSEYWIGFSASTTSGYPFALDNGPRIEGKGLWKYENMKWEEITSVDRNWCIRALVSQSTDINSTELDNNCSFFIYPNPAATSITFEGINTSTLVQIYSITGYLVKEFTIDGNTAVNIADLVRGAYLVKANGKTARFIKS